MSREITVAPAASLMMDASTQSKLAESLVMRGDISGLTAPQRVQYYLHTCNELGLNPNAQPFAFLKLNGKEVMYPTRGATDQLARIHQVNREIIDGPKLMDLGGAKLLFAACRATLASGRVETATAAVPLPSGGEAIANAVMKVETKARRRATLAILGLALTDESEMDTIPAAARVDVPAPSREEIAQAMAAAKAPALPPLASLGVEVQPAATPAPVEARDLVAEVRESAAVRHTARELADLWRSSREELKAASKLRPAWDVIAARALELKLTPAAVKAEVARLDDGPGPKGGTPRPEAPTHTEATGDSIGTRETMPAPAQASADAWRETADGIVRHVAGISAPRHLESSARQHLRAVPEALQLHAVHVYAGRLQRLSHDGTSSLAWDECVATVERWLREGPRVTELRPHTRTAPARRAVG